MRRSCTTVRLAAALTATVLTTVTAAGCDLVDENDGDSTPRTVKVQRRFDGRTLLLVQPARVSDTDGPCRPATTVACSLTQDTSYELLGGPSRISMVNARVVHADDGSWGVQARFARASEETLTAARDRATTDETALLLVGNGNRALLDVPTDADTGRLVLTSGESEKDALAVIRALADGG